VLSDFDDGIERILCFGLQKLHDIATSGTYEARYKLLHEEVLGWIGTYYDSFDIRLFGYPVVQVYIPVGQPFFDDPNIGPEKAW
jgi:hypothetical protein